MEFIRERCEIVEICRRLYDRGLISGPEGNVSVRLAAAILTTPAGCCKGFLSAADVVAVDDQGRPVGGSGRPTSELPMHLAIYRARDDVGAIVHAHPPAVVALSLARKSIPRHALAESIAVLGEVARVEFELPGSAELGSRVAEALGPAGRAAILEHHGAVTVGRTLQEAWLRMETLAAVCQTIWMAHAVGEIHELPQAAVQRLLERLKQTS